MLVHQVEVQRKGGACAKYPSSCIVLQLLDQAGLLKPLHPIVILDLTYGQGIFYYSIKGKAMVYALDIRHLKWVIKPYRFMLKSCEHWREFGLESVDVIVVDPPFSPYKRGWERRKHYEENCSVVKCINEGLKAAEHYSRPLLVHYPFRVQPYGWDVSAEVWFQGWTRLSKLPKPTWFGILRKER